MEETNNQQINTQVPNAVAQPPTQSPTSAPQQVNNQVPKSGNRYLLYGVLLGLVLVVIVGIAVFYMLYQPKEDNNVAVVPTPVPTVSEEEADVPEIAGVSDLDNIIVGLAEAEESLDQELAKLEKDSNF